MERIMKRIAITGAKGLLGWHSAAHLHAANCGARFNGDEAPYDIIQIDHAAFDDGLSERLHGVDAILHFAGVNRGDDVETANPEIAQKLVDACAKAQINPHIVYANSSHAAYDTPYGNAKRIAGEILSQYANRYTNMILPHIFGECARPHYNNVTATLIDCLWNDKTPEINPEGRVNLLHAGAAADSAIDAILTETMGDIAPKGRDMSIHDLYEKLSHFHALYQDNIFPNLSDDFDLALFNSYRSAAFPHHYPKAMKINSDHRGTLFESAKGGNASHTFLSTTAPGKIRGDHFHLGLVERFLVVSGEAIIRIRKVLTDEVHEFHVSGDTPVAIDQIPLHTHNIENIGDEDVITFFWAHSIFDPSNPDTYADPV